jgi:hypothetical protein
LILPKASCEDCADVTMRFEGAYQQACIGMLRIRTNAPTRHKKQRPTSLKYPVLRPSGKTEVINVPAEDLPRMLVMLRMKPPTLISGLPPVSNFYKGDEFWVWYESEDLKRMSQGYKALGHFPGKLLIDPFVQMIAKIAYAHAVSKLGYNSFRPLVLDVIFGKTDIPTHWVGGIEDQPPAVDKLMHQLVLNTHFRIKTRFFVVVDVRLFAVLGAPTFRVVVGQRKGFQNEIRFIFNEFRNRVAKHIPLWLRQIFPVRRKRRK